MSVIAQLIPAGAGYAYQPASVMGLHRQDGSPSQLGDVLSVQPNGDLQTRPKEEIGAWETMTLQGPLFLYATDGTHSYLYLPPGL